MEIEAKLGMTERQMKRRGDKRRKEIDTKPKGSSGLESRARGIARSHRERRVRALGLEEGDRSQEPRGSAELPGASNTSTEAERERDQR